MSNILKTRGLPWRLHRFTSGANVTVGVLTFCRLEWREE
jgi:hypothetical protein